MNETLHHRGPDAAGEWSDASGGIYLGHRRLSIIDIEGGAQPMWTHDGMLGIVFNGEIYNFRELRHTLEQRGHVFSSDHSDTEVLLYGYREWGAGLPQHLNGMWAFAIFDKKKNGLFLSRDRFGKKPLYHAQRGDTFMFASELTALRRHPQFGFSPSTLALKKYFAYNYIPAPLTLYEQVYKLPGGCNLFYSLATKTVTVNRYWEFTIEPVDTSSPGSEARLAGELRDHLDNAVSRRLVSDVPLGIFLSGGIDSTAVATFASKHVEPRLLNTFSIGFEEPSFDESAYSTLAAAALGTSHHHATLSIEKAVQLLPAIAAMIDEPLGDSSLLPTYLLCNECRKKVTVALGGDGADELFAGYDPFVALHSAELYAALVPKSLHTGIRLLFNRLPVSHVNMSADFRIKRTLRGLGYEKPLWNPVWQASLDPAEINELFADHTPVEELFSEAIDSWEHCSGDTIVDRTLEYFTRLYLQNDILTKVDRAGMMNSLEVRAPFLDIDLVNFARRLPSHLKYRRGTTKYLLRKALAPLLPKKILSRRKKGFGVPVGTWFKTGQLGIDPDQIPHGFDSGFVNRQIVTHKNGTRDNRGFLWNLWMLSDILGRNVSR